MHTMTDLRSDTITRPSKEMREVIANAEVGDDVFGDDPSVNRLQELAARRFGKEAALFVPSGTMANQLALQCHCRPGDHVIVPTGAHVLHYEGGGGAVFAGVQITEQGANGRYDLAALAAAVHSDDHHFTRTRLITLENTHNRAGGRIVPTAHVAEVSAFARSRGCAIHMDGARVFNAVVEGADPLELGRHVDTLSFCLSKGLGAPVGSLLLGTVETIDLAHRCRKRMGGGMRQAGLLAAAGLYALEHNVERLREDHRRANALARGLAEVRGLSVEPGETNILFFELDEGVPMDAAAFVAACEALGVRSHATGPRRVRWVTHLDIDDDDCQKALDAVRKVSGFW